MTTLERLQEAYESALSAYKADRQTSTDPVSIAFDAGRVDGLKEAIAILETYTQSNG